MAAGTEPQRERVLIEEVMRLTGLPARTIQSLAIRGQIPGAGRLGRRWTFNRERLVAWIKDREAATAAQAGPARSYQPSAPPETLSQDDDWISEALARKLAQQEEAAQKRHGGGAGRVNSPPRRR